SVRAILRAMESVADIVRRARHESGLTQVELAARAGTTQSAIARIESGRGNPRVGTIHQLMTAVGRRLTLGYEEAASECDETMIAANLSMTPAQRLDAFSSGYASVRRLVGSRA